MSTSVTFKQIGPDEARIYDTDGDYVGDLFRHRDVLDEHRHLYVIHLSEDPRGPVLVHERERIREVTQGLLGLHPLWS